MLTATCSSDLIATLRGGPYSAVTQLRVNPSCKPSFLEVHLVQGGDFLGANSCAPTPSHSPWECIYLPLVPRTWFASGRGPLMVRICPRGLPEGAWVLHKSGYSSLVLGIWPWSHLSLLFITVLRYWDLSWCRPLHSLSYPWVSGGDTVDVLSWRRLNLATPNLGNGSPWRRLPLATPTPGDALSGQPVDFLPLGPLEGPTIRWLWLWLWLWQCSGTGRYNGYF